MDTETIFTNLINIRTQLTVATLATARLRRASGRADVPDEDHAAESARLFAYLDRSLSQMERETRCIETTLAQRQHSSTERSHPLRLLLGIAAAGAMAANRLRRGPRQMIQTIV